MTDASKINKLISKHPIFSQNSALQELCKPLTTLGIHYFSHARITSDQTKLSLIALRPDFIQYYLTQGFYQYDLHNKPVNLAEQLILWDNYQLTGPTKQLNDEFRAIGYGHTFSIVLNQAQHRDYYHFAAPIEQSHMNAQYLEHLDLLRNFISYFNEKVHSHKSLEQIYEDEFSLIQEEASCQTSEKIIAVNSEELKSLMKVERYYIPGTNVYLSQRELECLYWTAKGKTAEVTAEILNLSPRTIKAHIENIKRKLKCYNYFQLGMEYEKILQNL